MVNEVAEDSTTRSTLATTSTALQKSMDIQTSLLLRTMFRFEARTDGTP